MRLLTLKLLIVSVVAGALMLAGAAAAFADTGSQNADFTVSVDLVPDVAAVGDTVSASASVTNNTVRWQFAKLCLSVTVDTSAPYSACKSILLAPKQALSFSYSLVLPYSAPGTTATIGLSASNANGTSSASDSITFA
jgi:hypothetical protein